MGMKSMSVAAPSFVSNLVSRISVLSRYFHVTRAEGSVGAIKNRPLSGVPSKAAKHAAKSKLGGQNQSTEPDFDTSAAVSQLPMRP
jgi:hypothetical protein